MIFSSYYSLVNRVNYKLVNAQVTHSGFMQQTWGKQFFVASQSRSKLFFWVCVQNVEAAAVGTDAGGRCRLSEPLLAARQGMGTDS